MREVTDVDGEVADAVVAARAPIRDRHLELSRDPGHFRSVLRAAAARASEQAGEQAGEKVRQAERGLWRG